MGHKDSNYSYEIFCKIKELEKRIEECCSLDLEFSKEDLSTILSTNPVTIGEIEYPTGTTAQELIDALSYFFNESGSSTNELIVDAFNVPLFEAFKYN